MKKVTDMKKVTERWLEKHNACASGMAYYRTLKCTNAKEIIYSCLEISRFDWAVWVLVRLMTPKQRLAFAVWCAEKVLPYWEAKYPEDMRPRNAVTAAKRVLRRNTKQAREAAREAADAATAASVDAATAAAVDAGRAAYFAARTTAADAGRAAYFAAATSAAADLKQDIVNYGLQQDIVNYGLQLIGYSKD